jgi:hypothetical protein
MALTRAQKRKAEAEQQKADDTGSPLEVPNKTPKRRDTLRMADIGTLLTTEHIPDYIKIMATLLRCDSVSVVRTFTNSRGRAVVLFDAVGDMPIIAMARIQARHSSPFVLKWEADARDHGDFD